MGTWGAGIFADDVALDVRDDYRQLRRAGMSVRDASDAVLEQHSVSLADQDDGPVIWLALAALQLADGAVEDRVRDQALAVIDDGSNVRRWVDSEGLGNRKRVLASLAKRLRNPPPPRGRTPRKPMPKPSRHPRVPVIEGGWYAVPLLDGRYALCVVTYFDGGHFVGFYFGPPAASVDELKGRPGPSQDDHVCYEITSSHGIREGRWPAIERHTDVSDWPLPEFVRREGSTDEYLVTVAPRDYSWYVARRRRPPGDDPRRGHLGFAHSQALELILSRLLGIDVPDA